MYFRSFVLSALGTVSRAAFADDVLDIQGRRVAVDAQTQIIVDDLILPPGSPVPQKPGMRVEARFADMVGLHGVGGGGPAVTVIFSYALKGPVTSIDPLRVLGQEITVTADTQTAGLRDGSLDGIVVGDHLEVSGYVDSNSSVLASFVEFAAEPIGRWLLSGYVSAVDAETIRLGPQRIDIAGIAPQDCGDVLAVGQFVGVRADAMPEFGAETVLDTVTELRCMQTVPIGTPGATGAMNGIVGNFLSDTSFQFGPYAVHYNASTEFRFGTADDIAAGAALEVDGVFGEDLAFTAQGIQFDAPVIRLEGPAEIADVVPGADGSVTLLGNLVHRSAQLRDEDGIFVNGINQPQQIELRGYLDRLGNRYATRARLRGDPDASDARAGGPVTWVERPLLGVLGLSLDTSGALFEDAGEQAIDEDAFFLDALPGALVEQTGSWDEASGTIAGGVVALIALAEPPPPPANQWSLIVGTLRGTDRLFAGGFD